MTLNKYSYCHKNIRLLCYQLEQKTQMQLKTKLDGKFYMLVFKNDLQYLLIDWQDKTYATLCYKLDAKEVEAIEDIILYLDWLETGKKYERKHKPLKKRRKVATKRKNKKVA